MTGPPDESRGDPWTLTLQRPPLGARGAGIDTFRNATFKGALYGHRSREKRDHSARRSAASDARPGGTACRFGGSERLAYAALGLAQGLGSLVRHAMIWCLRELCGAHAASTLVRLARRVYVFRCARVGVDAFGPFARSGV